MKSFSFISLLIVLAACLAAPKTKPASQVAYEKEAIQIDSSYIPFPWLSTYQTKNNLINSIALPKGYYREKTMTTSFTYWLQHLPLKPDDKIVNLYNGDEKGIQSAQFAILDIDVGTLDLQQCADAVMRLRAEYLFAEKRFGQIQFHYTSGDLAPWDQWRKGMRPIINGNKVSWKQTSSEDNSYKNFKKYLINIFSYCGSLSLSRELEQVEQIHDIKAGDVFIRGGTPGHAVIVLDVAINKQSGKKIFLLAQSYMPAQEIHILNNPNREDLSPWYEEDFGDELITPQYTFTNNELMRFP